ncbi:hypothetical protein SO802_028951 [Lithocarpus litseifolius]|uniref:Reverse transcriptase zinc-binding domain-containing protein n=1 Tax=Lithocarpus litseifolius TaxID=425828 RepID=A0AAW2BU73_9ROSI
MEGEVTSKSTFVWKLLHDCLPVKLMLANRGIPVVDVCPMCNSESESPSHLFLYCDLARAVWHGSELSIKTTELNQVLVKQWLASKRDRKTRRSGYAFEAINKEVNKIFMGCNSIGNGPRRKDTRGEEGTSHRALKRYNWEKGFDERELEVMGEVSSLE